MLLSHCVVVTPWLQELAHIESEGESLITGLYSFSGYTLYRNIAFLSFLFNYGGLGFGFLGLQCFSWLSLAPVVWGHLFFLGYGLYI